jgi:hypothetical protein
MVDERAGRRRRRAAAPLLALVGVLVLVAAGCGGKSADEKANEAYANSVCGAIATWEQQVKSIATDLSSSSLSKASLETKMTQVESETKTLVTQIKAVPPPDTSDGKAAKQQLDQFSNDVTTTVNSAKSAVAQIPSDASATTIASTLAPLVPQVKSLASSGESTVKTVQDAGGSLSSAFKNSDSCKSLSGSS